MKVISLIMSDELKEALDKFGNLEVDMDGQTYTVGYSANEFVIPYGICFPGEDEFRFIKKDKEAQKVWRKLQMVIEAKYTFKAIFK